MAMQAYIIEAKAKWAKVLGEAPPGYENGPAEWSFDAILNDKSKARVLEVGVDPFYIKSNTDGEEYIKFVRKALRADGTEAKPIEVVDAYGKPWDQNVFIGNGSDIRVQFVLNEVKSKGTKRLKPSVLRVQVWELVEYKAKSPFEVKEPGEASESVVDESENWQ